MEYFYYKPFKCMGKSSYFSTIFTQGDNFCVFLFASMDNKTLSKGVNSQRKEFAPEGANSFFKSRLPFRREARNEIDRVASPDSTNSFFKSRLPFRREERNENGRVTSPESANSFFKSRLPFRREERNEKDRVASPDSANSFFKSILPFRREAINEKRQSCFP